MVSSSKFNGNLDRIGSLLGSVLVLGGHDTSPGDLGDYKTRKAARQRLELAVVAGEMGIWEWDIIGNRTTWDARMFALHGHQPNLPAEPESDWGDYLHADDVPEIERVLQQALRGETQYDVEFRVNWPDGTQHYLHSRAMLIHNRKGEPVKLVGAAWDITRRKQAEETLRESGEYFSALFEQLPEAAMVCDFSGRLLMVNRAFESLSQLPRIRAINKDLLQLKLFNARDMLEWVKSLAVLTDEIISPTIELNIKPRGAPRRIVSVRLFPLLIGDQRVVLSTLHDVTMSKQAEAQLRQRSEYLSQLAARLTEVEEIEKRQLARELHDRIGQNLTALSLNVHLIQDQLPEQASELVRERVADTQRLLVETSRQVRDVMADLRPPVLDDYGLLAALHWHCEQFRRRTGILAMVQGALPQLSPSVETVLFRIAQEALNNVAKHAKATQVIISLSIYNEKYIEMTIADNGIGLRPHKGSKQSEEQHWGLKLMQERAAGLGGEMTVESTPRQGTKIQVRVPGFHE